MLCYYRECEEKTYTRLVPCSHVRCQYHRTDMATRDWFVEHIEPSSEVTQIMLSPFGAIFTSIGFFSMEEYSMIELSCLFYSHITCEKSGLSKSGKVVLCFCFLPFNSLFL